MTERNTGYRTIYCTNLACINSKTDTNNLLWVMHACWAVVCTLRWWAVSQVDMRWTTRGSSSCPAVASMWSCHARVSAAMNSSTMRSMSSSLLMTCRITKNVQNTGYRTIYTRIMYCEWCTVVEQCALCDGELCRRLMHAGHGLGLEKIEQQLPPWHRGGPAMHAFLSPSTGCCALVTMSSAD